MVSVFLHIMWYSNVRININEKCIFLYFSEFPFSPKKTVEPFRSPEGKGLPSPSIVPQQVIISPEYPPSPKKHLLSPRGSDHPLSPRKDLSLDHFYSPRRNILSPKKSDFLLSPRKVMSPTRTENQFSSRNLLMSPGTMMSNLKLSSPVRVPLSPRKMDYNIMPSPGKTNKGGLSLISQGSPVKSLFSPNNSLKLEKQEGNILYCYLNLFSYRKLNIQKNLQNNVLKYLKICIFHE